MIRKLYIFLFNINSCISGNISTCPGTCMQLQINLLFVMFVDNLINIKWFWLNTKGFIQLERLMNVKFVKRYSVKIVCCTLDFASSSSFNRFLKKLFPSLKHLHSGPQTNVSKVRLKFLSLEHKISRMSIY